MKEALSVNFLKKAISVLLSAVMVFGVMTFSEFGQCEAEATKIVHKGIDVSVYQGSIDFKKVKAAGYDFVIIRAATESCSVRKIRTLSRITAEQRLPVLMSEYIGIPMQTV